MSWSPRAKHYQRKREKGSGAREIRSSWLILDLTEDRFEASRKEEECVMSPRLQLLGMS